MARVGFLEMIHSWAVGGIIERVAESDRWTVCQVTLAEYRPGGPVCRANTPLVRFQQ